VTAKPDHGKITEYAREAVRRDIFGAVREAGGQLIERLISIRHPDWGTTLDASPADGLVAARAVEMAARRKVADYLRDARETGLSWRKIGIVLGLEDQARRQDVHVADLAFDAAAGPRDDHSWYERYFAWRCHECGELLQDSGPEAYPEPGRGGHRNGCNRLGPERRAYSLYCKESSR
jgi:hypothetical protein